VFVSRTTVRTREAVLELLGEGVERAEIARRLGLAKSTVSYHARRVGAEVDQRCARRYDWAAVQAFYDEGRTVAECVERFGFSRQSWHAARLRGALVTRPTAMSLDELCAVGTHRNRFHVKRRLIAAGVLAQRCDGCAISTWLGAPIALELHHRNGDGDDNRIANLQLLCPNCHSQTETFGRRLRSLAGPAQAADWAAQSA
jgi:DNA-binding transcriptional ArsR family regulator